MQGTNVGRAKGVVLFALVCAAAAAILRRLHAAPAPPASEPLEPQAPSQDAGRSAVAAAPSVPPLASEPAAELRPAPASQPPVLARPRPVRPTERARRPRWVPRAAAAAALACIGAAVAIGIAQSSDEAREPTSSVLGTQFAQTAPLAVTTEATPPKAKAAPSKTKAAPAKPAGPRLPSASAATPVRARGAALLRAPDGALPQFVGARVTARRVRVDSVVGDRIFWVGRGGERMLVHIQGRGTRWAVKRGQRVSFTAILTRSIRGARSRWGLEASEGLAEQRRQGHHLEVYGPDMRFDCLRRCQGLSG